MIKSEDVGGRTFGVDAQTRSTHFDLKSGSMFLAIVTTECGVMTSGNTSAFSSGKSCASSNIILRQP